MEWNLTRVEIRLDENKYHSENNAIKLIDKVDKINMN